MSNRELTGYYIAPEGTAPIYDMGAYVVRGRMLCVLTMDLIDEAYNYLSRLIDKLDYRLEELKPSLLRDLQEFRRAPYLIHDTFEIVYGMLYSEIYDDEYEGQSV